MLLKFKEFVEKELQLTISDRILLTVSGGADSVLMLYLFSKAGYDCGIAHCNFHLRDKESDSDEELVSKLAQKYNFPFYKSDFNTIAYANENGISIEMAARDLRYTWFEKIRNGNNYKFIATAHHQDDVIETCFINLVRGTGIRGLTGFSQKRNMIIRPILFADRNSIMEFIEKEKLEFREDKSNSDVKIIRNNLRHNIIPLFNKINPSYKQSIIQSIGNLSDAEFLMNQEILRIKTDIIETKGNHIYLNINKLLHLVRPEIYLFELIQTFGFNRSQVSDMVKTLESAPGKVFRSKTHELVKDRSFLIINKISIETESIKYIHPNDDKIKITSNIELNIRFMEKQPGFKIPKEANIAAIDFEKLKFPLKIRKWEQGDYFFPLGMNQKKKISDFLIDQKHSLIEKQEIYLLMSDNDVVWIIGKRIDNRFKITEDTTGILMVKIESEDLE